MSENLKTIRVQEFSILQTAKILGTLYFLGSLFICVPAGLFLSLASSQLENYNGPGALLFFFLPIIYGALGFVMTAAGCGFYNLIGKRMGGIEFKYKS